MTCPHIAAARSCLMAAIGSPEADNLVREAIAHIDASNLSDILDGHGAPWARELNLNELARAIPPGR